MARTAPPGAPPTPGEPPPSGELPPSHPPSQPSQEGERAGLVKIGKPARPDDGPGTMGESWLTTTLEGLEDWAQRYSFWPFPFGTACCAIEFMSTVSSHYDVSRFGSEVVRFSPRQSDVLLVAGTINDKMGPVLKTIYDQMADPKWVISMGACACSGGFYRAYHVMQGIDEIIPVDVYVPGCPPTPEGLMYGILQLRELVARDRRQLAAQPRKQGEEADLGAPEI